MTNDAVKCHYQSRRQKKREQGPKPKNKNNSKTSLSNSNEFPTSIIDKKVIIQISTINLQKIKIEFNHKITTKFSQSIITKWQKHQQRFLVILKIATRMTDGRRGMH